MQVVRFGNVEAPEQELAKLVRLYWAGQVAPLPFFPGTAREFASRLSGSKVDDLSAEEYQKALMAATKVFEGSTRYPGEGADPYITHLYDGASCLERGYRPFENIPRDYQDFESMASALFTPLFAKREQEAL